MMITQDEKEAIASEFSDPTKNKTLPTRLRCMYPKGRIMEDGMPEFGFKDYSGTLTVTLPTAIMLEASHRIEALEKSNFELLKALKDLLAYVEDGYGDNESLEGERARKAIAKAEGKV